VRGSGGCRGIKTGEAAGTPRARARAASTLTSALKGMPRRARLSAPRSRATLGQNARCPHDIFRIFGRVSSSISETKSWANQLVTCTYTFMALELVSDALAGAQGRVVYPPAFGLGKT
jgi:hypothetical protein